ncbi:hypothetical protein CHUAL_014126 [Chamberlinius hualienensis]
MLHLRMAHNALPELNLKLKLDLLKSQLLQSCNRIEKGVEVGNEVFQRSNGYLKLLQSFRNELALINEKLDVLFTEEIIAHPDAEVHESGQYMTDGVNLREEMIQSEETNDAQSDALTASLSDRINQNLRSESLTSAETLTNVFSTPDGDLKRSELWHEDALRWWKFRMQLPKCSGIEKFIHEQLLILRLRRLGNSCTSVSIDQQLKRR